MIKPRCGFYITEKFPKVPKYLPDGNWEVSMPDGAIVIYDMKAFLDAPDEEVLAYCKELVEHYGLAFEPKELMDLVALFGITNSLPEDKEKAKEVIKRTPGLELIEDEQDN
jgi:hypothetical protein